MEEEMEFSEYFRIIKANFWLILAVFAVVMAGMAAYTILAPPTYESQAMVMIKNQDQATLLLGGNLPKADINTQAQIMQSSNVLGQVEDILPDADFKITVSAVKDTNVIEIKTESPDPFVAMMAANLAAEAFINYSIESRRQDALEVIDFITIQADEIRSEIDTLNIELVKYTALKNLSAQDRISQQGLTQQLNAKDRLYSTLITRREEVGIVAREDYGNIRIIQDAEFPLMPSKPNIFLNLALGLVLGAMLGLGAAFVREQVKNTFRGQSDVEAMFGPIVFETLPKVSFGKHSRTGSDSRLRQRFTEGIRMLRTNVLFYLKDKDFKVFVLTSPSSGSGKTTVAASLGISIAASGEKVLLVDADFRTSGLSKDLLGIEESRHASGLSDLILSMGNPAQYVHKTEHKNLFVIPSGSQNDSPGELMSSNSMKALCQKLQKLDYSAVIFDSPSMEFAESGELASACGRCVLVIALGRTNRDIAEKSKKALQKLKSEIAGVILTYGT